MSGEKQLKVEEIVYRQTWNRDFLKNNPATMVNRNMLEQAIINIDWLLKTLDETNNKCPI